MTIEQTTKGEEGDIVEKKLHEDLAMFTDDFTIDSGNRVLPIAINSGEKADVTQKYSGRKSVKLGSGL